MYSSYLIWSYLMVAAVMIGDTTVMAHSFIGTFSMNGLRATVQFTPSGGAYDIVVSVTDGLDSDVFSWDVYQFPMMYDRFYPCTSIYTGPIFSEGFGNFTQTHGNLSITKGIPLTFYNSNITFNGPKSLSGRTLVLQSVNNENLVACASLLPVGDVTTAIATFQKPLVGTVTFRQLPGSATPEDTTIYAELQASTKQDLSTLDWHIYTSTGYSPEMTLEEQCESIINSVADLTTLSSLNISRVLPANLYYFVNSDISLEGPNSVIGMSVVLFNRGSTEPLACATIRNLAPRNVACFYSTRSVTGTITFKQRSPWEATYFTVDLQGLGSRMAGYHLHVIPLPPRFFDTDDLASIKGVSGRWDPYFIEEWPADAVGTEDQYEMGDISRKYGQLTDLETINVTYTDWNMPLFGTNSIIGLALVVHLLVGNQRYAYGQIEYPTPVKTVVVEFKGPIIGTIVFRQAIDDPLSETTVSMDLANINGTETENHNFHVHEYPAGKDYLDKSKRCLGNGGNFNPFEVDVAQGYDQCTVKNPRRCYAGDLAHKHRRLVVADAVHTAEGKAFYTDVQLPLSGPYSIVGRSVIIHGVDSTGKRLRLACDNAFEVLPKEVKTTEWTDKKIKGSITFKQPIAYNPASLIVDVDGLDKQAAGWHTHVLNVPYEDDDACTETLGHYNPYNIFGVPSADATQDMYEVGDLSGKFVSMADKSSVRQTFIAQITDLRGSRSVDGRSIVIHKTDGSRWSCASLDEVLPCGASLVKAVATFSNSDFSGTIKFRQTHYENDFLGDTIMDLIFESGDGSTTTAINDWNLLETTAEGACDGGGDLYNPFDVAGEPTRCGLDVHMQCKVGVLGGRHGSIPYGRTMFTDSNLPLIGRTPVIGRFLRLEINQQFYCAPILPSEDYGVVGSISFPAYIEYDPYDFREALSEYVYGLESWQVVSSSSAPSSANSQCQRFQFYIVGPEPRRFVQDISDAVYLDDYTQDECKDFDPIVTAPEPCDSSTSRTAHSYLTVLSFVTSFAYSYYFLYDAIRQ